MNALTDTPYSIDVQDDLFGSDDTHFSIDTSFKTATRFALDEHSWIEVVPGWMSGAFLLYEQLRNGVPWLEHERRMFNKVFLEPRMTATYWVHCVPKELDIPGSRISINFMSSAQGVRDR